MQALLKFGLSVRWRLLALVLLVALGFSSSGVHLLQSAGDAGSSPGHAARSASLHDLRTAFADYRYWQLASLTDAAEGRQDGVARAKVQLELAAQQLRQALAAAGAAAPDAAQLVTEQLRAIDAEIPRNPGQTAELRARLDSLYDRISGLADNTQANTGNNGADLGMMLGLFAASTLLAILLMRSITQPLAQLAAGAEGLTQGNLDAPLPTNRTDEIGAIAVALDRFRERARQWDHLAYHDPLTGLANRAKLETEPTAELAAVQQNGQSLILLYLGLDQLTTINDSFGPSAGDEFLKIAARRLRSGLPESSRAYYVGGSHFVVVPAPVANDMRMTGAADQLARMVVNDMSRPFNLQEQELEMSVKLGVVTFPQDGASYEDLVSNAYGALTHARRNPGSNFQFYTRQITEKARQRVALASQLRRAVQADELRVHYQPVLNVATNQVVAAEALMRWQHPTRGLIMPGEFIQVAEESGVISAMGEWCLARACQDTRRWREEGLDSIKLAVNLSARQLSEPGLVDIIQRTLENARMSPSELELEITESTVMQDPDSSVRVLRHLKSLGIGLSVDDFGTGYSSLTYLQRFPLDKIKIDRSFVSRLNRRRKDELIIAATTGLATDLGLEVVAEGVETQEQLRILRQLGCTLMQGFLFSRALPLDDFIKWARAPGVTLQPQVTLN